VAITVRQAIAWLLKCNAESELRIYFPEQDFSDIESIQEDLDELAVYFCGSPIQCDIHDRPRSKVEVVDCEVNVYEGCFTQVQKIV
jgi:hypothetical protein